eukprot:gene1149-1523_t
MRNAHPTAQISRTAPLIAAPSAAVICRGGRLNSCTTVTVQVANLKEGDQVLDIAGGT